MYTFIETPLFTRSAAFLSDEDLRMAQSDYGSERAKRETEEAVCRPIAETHTGQGARHERKLRDDTHRQCDEGA